jgi:hypothetical protein
VAKLIISRDAQVLQEVELGAERTSIGRHPDNDIVIDHQAVSAWHAAVSSTAGEVTLEDLGSSNGTLVDGQRIARTVLSDRDRFTIAGFHIDYVAGAAQAQPVLGSIEVLNGANAGKTMPLLKPLTTLGSPGALVVVISRQDAGYFIAQVQGDCVARVNQDAIGRTPRLLRDGDALELTGTLMRFSTKSC